MKLTNTIVISITAVASGTPIGDQATLRGRKILAIIALNGLSPFGTQTANVNQAFITLQTVAGRIIHENLPLAILVPNNNAGIVMELGNEIIDWTKSSVKSNGLVCFSVVYE